ncbi:MAG: hypothetical protein ACE5HF_09660 [Gemmatimonadota bacterium]
MKKAMLVGLAVLASAGTLSAQQHDQQHGAAATDAQAAAPSMPCGQMMKMMGSDGGNMPMKPGRGMGMQSGRGMGMQSGRGMMGGGGMNMGMMGMHGAMNRLPPLSPDRILGSAKALDLTPDQVGKLEELVKRRNEKETKEVRDILTPEQLDAALGGADAP